LCEFWEPQRATAGNRFRSSVAVRGSGRRRAAPEPCALGSLAPSRAIPRATARATSRITWSVSLAPVVVRDGDRCIALRGPRSGRGAA
jgi:hypothetical protein